MAGPRSVLRDLIPQSNELLRLVQDRPVETPRMNTLDDLKITIQKLTTFTTACESVSADIIARDKNIDLPTAVSRIKNVLTWANFLDTLDTTSSDPDFLFRAHTHIGASKPTLVPELAVPSGMDFRRALSVDDFSNLLNEHLNKTQTEKEYGKRIRTYFLSTSPILEWTVHKAGQKWKEKSGDEVVGLAILDLKKIRQKSGTIIFRVSDVLRFLASQDKDYLIQPDPQKWARNCDEYVVMGEIPNDAQCAKK